MKQSTLFAPPTTVVDIHKIRGERPPFDIYMGREVVDRNTGEIIMKASPYGNPFYREKYGDLCFFLYGLWLLTRMQEDPITYNLEELVGKALGDWCVRQPWYTPGKCHVFVILHFMKMAGLKVDLPRNILNAWGPILHCYE